MTSFETNESFAEVPKPGHIWYMFAGRDKKTGELRHFGVNEMYPRRFGHELVVRARLAEDPEGPYFGWLDTEEAPPRLIQPHWHAFAAQFAYGPEAKERAGQGRTVRLDAREEINDQDYRS